jgi:cytochrome P450
MLQEPVEFRGIDFPAGSVMFASAWNANREAAGDEQPERFDITAPRGSAKSLTFGAGPHFCLGSNLARAELQEGLAFLARKMPGLELDGEPRYGTITGLYGMESLPIRWTAARGA